MKPKFEIVSTYKDKNINLPVRATAGSAGYDFECCEDVLVPPHDALMKDMIIANNIDGPQTLDEIAALTKLADAKPTLVPTGIKCKIPKGMYLELAVRSSLPLKHWLCLANSVGVIDSDFYGPDGAEAEGHIMFQLINLSPFPIIIRKGERIGQGIFKHYYTTKDDALGDRERAGKGFGSTSV